MYAGGIRSPTRCASTAPLLAGSDRSAVLWQVPARGGVNAERPAKGLFIDIFPRNGEQNAKHDFSNLAFRIVLGGCRDTNNRRGRVRQCWEMNLKGRETRFGCERGSQHFGECLPVCDALDSGPKRHIPFPTIFHSGNATFSHPNPMNSRPGIRCKVMSRSGHWRNQLA